MKKFTVEVMKSWAELAKWPNNTAIVVAIAIFGTMIASIISGIITTALEGSALIFLILTVVPSITWPLMLSKVKTWYEENKDI